MDARLQPVGLDYLRAPLFEHFSPVTRLLDTLLVLTSRGDFQVAHGVQLALYAATVASFGLVVRTIMGNRWSALALTLVYGQSVFLIRLLGWWTATANILPATCLGLLSLAGYLRWQRGGSRWWLAVSLAAFAGSLLDYETAILFPAYLACIRLLVMEDKLDPRRWLSALWRERWAWLAYGVVDALAVVQYFNRYYFPVAHPTVRQLARYLEMASVETFVPALLGVRNEAGSLGAPAIALTWAVALAALGVTLSLRPRAWRALAAFAPIFLLTMTPVGLNRIRLFGVTVAAELYYQQSVHYAFWVLAAFAIHPRWGGSRPNGWPGRLAGLAGRRGTRVLAAVGVVAAAAYAPIYVTSSLATTPSSSQALATRAYVATFQASMDRAEALNHGQPVLVDLRVPGGIMSTGYAPYNRYDRFFPVVRDGVRMDEIADATYVVTDSGRLAPVRFVPSAVGMLQSATVSPLDGSGAVPAPHDGPAACVPEGHSSWRLHVPLSASQAVPADPLALPPGLRIRYRVPFPTAVPVTVDTGTGTSPDSGVDHVWDPVRGGELAPLIGQRTVDGLAFDLPPGSCLSEVTFGTFAYTGAPI